MTSLKGKTLFISGGSRGIGLAIALRAARDGANVAIAAKTAEPHPKLKGTIYTAASTGTGGMSTLGTSGGIQSQNYEQKPQGNATVSWVKRSHSIKIGSEWRATGYPNHNLASTAGSYCGSRPAIA